MLSRGFLARRHSFAAVDHIRRQPATSSSRPGAPPGADREWKSRQNQKLKTENWRLKARSWGLAAGSWKLGAGSWKLETGSWKLETESSQLEARSSKLCRT